MDDMKKELRLTRFFCIVSSLLTICLLAVIALLAIKLQPMYRFIEEAGPALQKVSELDIDTMNHVIQDLETSMGQMDWNELADSLEQLDKLDIETVNESLQSLDVEELSAALEHINNAADTLEGLSERFSALPSLFGR